jgi:hypothetical protein
MLRKIEGNIEKISGKMEIFIGNLISKRIPNGNPRIKI